jgi:MoxR-like ATPase
MTEPTWSADAPGRPRLPRLPRLPRALLAVRAEVAKAVVGQDAAVAGLLIGLLARGHVLLEGVPGVAKTLLVRALAQALSSRRGGCSSPPT